MTQEAHVPTGVQSLIRRLREEGVKAGQEQAEDRHRVQGGVDRHALAVLLHHLVVELTHPGPELAAGVAQGLVQVAAAECVL